MFGSLFIEPADEQTLSEFGRAICEILGIAGLVERESSNYLDGRYLMARVLGSMISISLADDEEFSDYSFHLSLKADGFWIEENTVFEGMADLMARKLTLAGYTVARCPDDGRVGASLWRYSVKNGSRGTAKGEILVDACEPS